MSTSTEHAVEARRLEAEGDLLGAASAWRRHLSLRPDDRAVRWKLGSVLAAAGEYASARQVLLELGSGDDAAAEAANVQLAELDEIEGALTDAVGRWERALSYDIDHSRARARLQVLRPERPERPRSAAETLTVPEGAHALRYALLREIGRGATSAVYLARDRSLELPVALKILHPHLAGATHRQARERFFVEAKLLAGLRHPGVVAIYDIDEPTRSLAMELIRGGSLRARLRAGREAPDRSGPLPLSPDEIVSSATTLVQVLCHLHRHGIVHGDIKPGNLLLRAPGQLVLADFGSARLRAATDGASAGTPLYLAPEQLHGSSSCEATDVFAAGAVIWELLAARPMRQEIDLLNEGRLPPAPPPLPVGSDARLVELAELAVAMVATEPMRRPSARDALARLPDAR